MTVKLADAIVALGADVDALRSDLNKAEGVAASSASEMESRTSAMGSVIQGVYHAVGGAIVNFAANALSKAGSYISESISAASDMGETVSKVNTLFGDRGAAIQEWAAGADTALGLSKLAALDAMGAMGNMFMQLGASTGEAEATSQSMIGLAADLASFHNAAGGTNEVLETMQAAFRGEYDSIQRFIPTINAAAVEQEALNMTHKASAKELTALEKAMAVQAILMRDAGAAAGDFARTSGGAANQQRILEAQLANVKATLGEALLPLWGMLVTVMNELVSTVMPPLADFLSATIVPAVAKFAEVLGNLISALVDAGAGSSEVREAIGLLPAALQPIADFFLMTLVPAIAEIGASFGRFLGGAIRELPTVFSDLKSAFAWILAGKADNIDWWWDITDAFARMGLVSQETADKLADNFFDIGVAAGTAFQFLKDLAAQAAQALQPVVTWLLSTDEKSSNLRNTLSSWLTEIKESSVFTRLVENVTNLGAELAPLGAKFAALWTVLQPIVIKIGEIIGAVLGVIAIVAIELLSSTFDHLAGVIGAVVDTITALLSGDLAGVFTGIKDLAVEIFGILFDTITSTLNTLGFDVDAWLGTFKTNWDAAWDYIFLAYHTAETYLVAGWSTLEKWLTETLPGAFTALLNDARTTWQSISDAVTSKITPITDALSGLKTWLEDSVANAFRSLQTVINGLTFSNPFSGMMSWLGDLIADIQWVIDHIPLIGGGGNSGQSQNRTRSVGIQKGELAPIGTNFRSMTQVPALALAGAGNGGSSSISINVYASTVASEIDEYQLAYKIADVIRRNR